MPATFKTVTFFRSSQLDVLFAIHDVLDDTTHPQHQFLLDDLNSIDADELSAFVTANHVDSMITRQESAEQARRVHFLTHAMQQQVAGQILQELCSDAERPRPYDSDNLRGIPIDSHHLISTEIFTESTAMVYNGLAMNFAL